MMNTKQFKSKNLKIMVGFFFQLLIYYVNNLFMYLGTSDKKIGIISSVFVPLLFLL